MAQMAQQAQQMEKGTNCAVTFDKESRALYSSLMNRVNFRLGSGAGPVAGAVAPVPAPSNEDGKSEMYRGNVNSQRKMYRGNVNLSKTILVLSLLLVPAVATAEHTLPPAMVQKQPRQTPPQPPQAQLPPQSPAKPRRRRMRPMLRCIAGT